MDKPTCIRCDVCGHDDDILTIEKCQICGNSTHEVYKFACTSCDCMYETYDIDGACPECNNTLA